MACVDTALVPGKISADALTAPLALRLAEDALKAGRLDSATRYVNIAYAIFDAGFSRCSEELSALYRGND